MFVEKSDTSKLNFECKNVTSVCKIVYRRLVKEKNAEFKNKLKEKEGESLC